MKVQEIYDITKSLMFEKPSSTIYDNYVVPNLNRVLRELFEENNHCRIFNHKAPLTEVPYVTDFNSEVDYEDEYLNNVIPLGLASRFLIDDDLSKYSLFNTDYTNARTIAQKVVVDQ